MKIEKCPFCGKEVAEISNCQELEGCRHFEKCPATEPYVCVVCSMFEGGCGSCSGYYDSAGRPSPHGTAEARKERGDDRYRDGKCIIDIAITCLLAGHANPKMKPKPTKEE